MLQITILPVEQFNEDTSEFFNSKEQILQLEHSLVSLSKWESRWKKPFLSKNDKTFEESVDYIRCMTITQNVDPNVYSFLTKANILEVSAYIEDPMTATTFAQDNKPPSREIITAEIIYYWMIAYNVPFECQKWHLNRLLTLINVCNIKNQPSKKMSKKDIARNNTALNEARRAQLNTRG